MWLDLVNLFKEKRKYRKENLLFLENYPVNAGLSRFYKGLSIVKLVEHRFMRNLIMLNIVVNYIQKNKLFLAQSAIYLRHTRSVVEIVFQFKFFLNFVFFFKES